MLVSLAQFSAKQRLRAATASLIHPAGFFLQKCPSIVMGISRPPTHISSPPFAQRPGAARQLERRRAGGFSAGARTILRHDQRGRCPGRGCRRHCQNPAMDALLHVIYTPKRVESCRRQEKIVRSRNCWRSVSHRGHVSRAGSDWFVGRQIAGTMKRPSGPRRPRRSPDSAT